MATVYFTENLKRHIDCPPQTVSAENLRQALDQIFSRNPQLGAYILDEQGRLRKHILVSIDGELVQDRVNLTAAVSPESKIHLLQALSGG